MMYEEGNKGCFEEVAVMTMFAFLMALLNSSCSPSDDADEV